jgi:hypothetical protein
VALFYAGAVVTLYGTIFASTAAHSRLYADMARLLGWFERDDYESRLVWRRRFVWMLTVVPVVLFLGFQSPVKMVKAGGAAQAVMLPVIAVAALYLRHRASPTESRPGIVLTLGLWIAALLTICIMLFSGIVCVNR